MKIWVLPLPFSVFVLPAAAQSCPVIFAAASLKDALDDVALSYNKEKNLQKLPVFALIKSVSIDRRSVGYV